MKLRRAHRDTAPSQPFAERLHDALPQVVGMVLFGAALVGLWQLLYVLEVMSRIILPSPTETFKELWRIGKDLVTGGFIWEHYWVTAQSVLLGFLLAASVGIALGVIVGETRFGERVVMPYLVAVNAMPKVAFAPVFVAWLGFGIEAKVLLAAFVASFPVIVDTAAGLHSSEDNSLMLFRSIRASRWQTLVKLKLPSALPHIFAGLKTASVFAVVGVIFGEYLGGGKGMGEVIRLATSQLRMASVFAQITYLSILGLVAYSVLALIERRVVFWRQSRVLGHSQS